MDAEYVRTSAMERESVECAKDDLRVANTWLAHSKAEVEDATLKVEQAGRFLKLQSAKLDLAEAHHWFDCCEKDLRETIRNAAKELDDQRDCDALGIDPAINRDTRFIVEAIENLSTEWKAAREALLEKKMIFQRLVREAVEIERDAPLESEE